MSTINYSKWDHIEVSDDEDDTHPNIDTPSLFRWRHQARVERMEEAKKEKEQFKSEYDSHQQKLQEIKRKVKEYEKSEEKNIADLEKLKISLTEMENQEKEWKKKEEELKKKERLTPWNVDTLCKEGKSKTIINKPKKRVELTEEEKGERQVEFVKKYKDKCKKFGMFQKYEDSQSFLLENPELVCEETANYLVVWCIDLEMEEKHDLMHHVAHQTIVMQFILELSKQLDLDPRGCVGPFFSRIKVGEKQYMDAFNDELESFKGRIRARAKEKIEEAMKEYEEEERQKRLGPGGLDPVEVFESLPPVLQECFEKKDIPMLQKAIMELSREDAEYHLKRCIDSGLWVPDAKKDSDNQQEEEEVYDTPSEPTSEPVKEGQKSSSIEDVD
ncbi:hypothetical protein KUTeg_007418 [Tegillarca granosa]|uniref:Hsp90 chaperone protein kinase-targeting subunit n=1 Tax=Tegillarca granosa TaxID=220873 RepID=A0ABQ9FHS9_TEGGR|nr:hypothetical protein KUTeg_007418 [Tegillarca granosa]